MTGSLTQPRRRATAYQDADQASMKMSRPALLAPHFAWAAGTFGLLSVPRQVQFLHPAHASAHVQCSATFKLPQSSVSPVYLTLRCHQTSPRSEVSLIFLRDQASQEGEPSTCD